MKAKQSVIIKKTHPQADTRADAKRIAKRYADRLYTSRETASSWRFRQRPPSDFKKGSFRTERIGKHVSIVYGKLKFTVTP